MDLATKYLIQENKLNFKKPTLTPKQHKAKIKNYLKTIMILTSKKKKYIKQNVD